MESEEERLQTARKLRNLLEGQLSDIEYVRLDVQHRGESVFWNYGELHGKISIIGEVERTETIMLKLSPVIDCDGHTHLPSSLRIAADIHDRIKKYLEEHGERYEVSNDIYCLKREILECPQ